MTELGAEFHMVFAVKLAKDLGYTVEEVLDMPLATAIAYNSALDVIDGKKPVTAKISEDEKAIAKFLSDNQKDVLEAFKERRSKAV